MSAPEVLTEVINNILRPNGGAYVEAMEEVRSDVAALIDAAKRVDKLSLVILSAVHADDSSFEERVTAAILDLRAATAKAAGVSQ